MKPLYPTLKEKKRYILFKVISDSEFKFSAIRGKISEKLMEFLGELELSKAGILFFEETWNSENKTFIMRVGNKHVDKVKSSLALIKSIKNKATIISSLKTSGKLKKLKDFQEKVR